MHRTLCACTEVVFHCYLLLLLSFEGFLTSYSASTGTPQKCTFFGCKNSLGEVPVSSNISKKRVKLVACIILGPPEIYFGRIRANFPGADPERPKCARNIFRAF